MWYRIYSIVDNYSEWSIPTYIGGSVNNITVSRAQADWLVANNSLTVGASYSIVDYPTTGYERIILRAATSSEFEKDGIAFLSVPIHRAVVDDTIGSELLHFKSCWRSTGTYAVGDIVWFYGQMYANLTGATGSIRDTYYLNFADWNPLTPEIYPEFYTVVKHGVTYDFATNYVRKEWDEFGNEFGDGLLLADGFQARYNDWYLDIDTLPSNYLFAFEGNKCRRFYNNGIYGSLTEYSTIRIVGNTGDGDIYGQDLDSLDNPCYFSISNNVLKVQHKSDDYVPLTPAIYGNKLLLDTIGNQWPVSIDGNTLLSGTIKNNDLFNEAGDDEYTFITGNTISGTITDIDSATSSSIKVYNCLIEGTLTGETPWLYNTNILGIGTTLTIGAGGASASDCTFYESRTIAGKYGSTQERKGFIFASLYIGTGEFSFDRDASFHAPEVQTGCLLTSVGSNGITVAGTDINSMLITFIHAGWYSVEYNASALSAVKLDVESLCYNGATAIQDLYNKKTYTAIDEWINASISGYVYFSAGDTLSCKYRASGTGICTLELGQINVTIEYKGQ
jgi:hypothetical protein